MCLSLSQGLQVKSSSSDWHLKMKETEKNIVKVVVSPNSKRSKRQDYFAPRPQLDEFPNVCKLRILCVVCSSLRFEGLKGSDESRILEILGESKDFGIFSMR